MSFKLHDRVKWTNAGDGSGWAGDGRAEILAYDEARIGFPGGFPGSKDRPPSGPAVLLKLGHKDLQVWVEPDEIMPDLESLTG